MKNWLKDYFILFSRGIFGGLIVIAGASFFYAIFHFIIKYW